MLWIPSSFFPKSSPALCPFFPRCAYSCLADVTDGRTDVSVCRTRQTPNRDGFQFNHQSTRGHCIMTLEVEMPHPDMAGMKQKGRVYVCDLAGTEPAGDIVFAKYEKKVFPNGDIEHKYIGAHEDDRKTKELQVCVCVCVCVCACVCARDLFFLFFAFSSFEGLCVRDCCFPCGRGATCQPLKRRQMRYTIPRLNINHSSTATSFDLNQTCRLSVLTATLSRPGIRFHGEITWYVHA